MSLRPAWTRLRLTSSWTRQSRWVAAGTGRRSKAPFPPQYETLASCPEPTCSCAAMPDMPEGLPLDMTSKMSMPYYDRHVVVAGDVDAQAWPSKLEQDETSPIKQLKDLLGPKGEFYRPDFSVSVTASTLPGPPSAETDSSTPVYIFPDFVSVNVDMSKGINGSATTATDLKSFGKAIIHDDLLEPSEALRITSPVVLICGHGQRDQRCGILGPVLEAEFNWFASRQSKDRSFMVGLVSHIGGHKFAGNVVIYLPPGYKTKQGTNSLAGQTIWYGRVEPKHVEGIVTETIFGGKVIAPLLRGVHDFGRITAS